MNLHETAFRRHFKEQWADGEQSVEEKNINVEGADLRQIKRGNTE